MTKERTKRTDQELVQVSEHLLYEFTMLFGTARTMAQTKWPEQDNEATWSIKNSLIEAFTVHVRIVLDFLYNEGPQKDDVVAEDFFETPGEWQSCRPIMTDLLSTVRRRVGKEVAHLTYARIEKTEATRQWQFVLIADDIGTAVERFISIVPHARITERFASLIQNQSKPDPQTLPTALTGIL